MSPFRLSDEAIQNLLAHEAKGTGVTFPSDDDIICTDVFIAGSGPIGSTYARTIIDQNPNAKVLMADIGAQEDVVIGAHQKNAVKFQKDVDSFVYTIKGALQAASVPLPATYLPTLPVVSWVPNDTDDLVINGFNPYQEVSNNLPACAITRAVGGMATHWTCACPEPHREERKHNPINKTELDALLQRGKTLLDVNEDQFDESIRHRVVKNTLADALEGTRKSLLRLESLALSLTPPTLPGLQPLCRDLKTDRDILVVAKTYVVACGSVCTPQILWNSGIRPNALGKNLTEQSIAFCQIVLKRSIVEAISSNPAYKDLVAEHKEKHPNDPLPIPFDDPEPQVTIPYSSEHPWHTQIHRDAFSYGDVGPRSDPRVVVDLRFLGKSDIVEENQVTFSGEHTDIYGLPQPTFNVRRTRADGERDHRMMKDMTSIANILGGYLPGSEPQFMEAGLALHITGTTRIGNDPKTSVADSSSRVHGFRNLWVGGNGCIPDSTACNPTLTSVAIAIKGAESVVAYLK